jgi:hypothetical protein
MQSTTGVHHRRTHPILPKTYLVFPHPIALHPTHRVCNPDAEGCDSAMVCLLRWGQFPTRGALLRLAARHPLARLALEAPRWRETTAGWEGLALQRSQALSMHLPCIRGTQEAPVTGLSDLAAGFDRVALCLATGVFWLGLGIARAVEWSLRTIRPNRGDVGPPVIRSAARHTATASAVRAGRRSGCATAGFTTAWRR